MNSIVDRPFFSDIPLHDLTAELSEDGLRQRLSYEISQTDWDDETRQRVRAAEELALEIHRNDTRGKHPYSTHFLRVAVRIISRDHFNIQDPDLLVAALLHDTVEDHQEFYASFADLADNRSERDSAFDGITEMFSDRAATLTKAVTNPEPPSSIVTKEQKHEFYREHVRDVLATNEVAGVLKLSDFIDNCGGLKHNEDPQRQLRLADKYLPLIPDFREFIEHSRYFDDAVKYQLSRQLDRAEDYCLELLAA